MQASAKRRHLRRVTLVLAIFLTLVALVMLGGRLYLRLPVRAYYQASTRAFGIPGLWEGFVPQGLSYDAASESYFLTGYQKGGGAASPVWVVDRASGQPRALVRLAKEDGAPFTGHAGGLTVWDEFVYVAGGEEGCLWVFRRGDILSAGTTGQTVTALGRVPTALGGLTIGGAFTALGADGASIWVGEFYREPQYPTPVTHKFTTPAGDRCQALAACYRLDASLPLGMDPAAVQAVTLPDQAQGMVMDGDTMLISTSWGLPFSEILAYDTAWPEPFAEIGGVPLCALDSASRTASYRFPPMAEELEMVDGRLLTMCESASNAYLFGRLSDAQWCYATDLSRLGE